VKLAVTVLVVLLSGCATQHRYEYDNLLRMQPDCANQEAQIRFLERQSKLREGAFTGQPAGMPDYERAYVAQAKQIIWTLRSRCAN
jgi:hypothetical protein